MTDYYSDQARYVPRSRQGRKRCPIFLIFIVLIFIIMPFFNTTLPFEVGTSIRLICDYLGNIFQTIGFAMLAVVVIKAFLFQRLDLKWLGMGMLFLFVGIALTTAPSATTGFH